MKILLAEDDEDDRDFFYSFLKSRPDIFLLPVAENGEEVFNYLQEGKDTIDLPDIIILDQNMPRQNGIETLRQLKESYHLQSIPVFIYSTYADDNLRKQSIQLGAMAVVSKPLTADGYHHMIDEILKMTGETPDEMKA